MHTYYKYKRSVKPCMHSIVVDHSSWQGEGHKQASSLGLPYRHDKRYLDCKCSTEFSIKTYPYQFPHIIICRETNKTLSSLAFYPAHTINNILSTIILLKINQRME